MGEPVSTGRPGEAEYVAAYEAARLRRAEAARMAGQRPDPPLSEFVRDVALGSDDKAEWYEQLAWRMVDRAAALEAVAASARQCESAAAAYEACMCRRNEGTADSIELMDMTGVWIVARGRLEAALEALTPPAAPDPEDPQP
jgi:hypothetical protein